jgi:beta-galactosidase
MKTKTIQLFILLIISIGWIEAQPPREKLLLDYGWRFSLGNAQSPKEDFQFMLGYPLAKSSEVLGAASVEFVDTTWRKVDLPHDWAVELPFVNAPDNKVLRDHGFKQLGIQYPETSIGWYRKTFTLPKEDENNPLSIKFGGVYRNSIV